MIPFLWKWVHFRSVFCRTLSTVSSLMDGGILAFTITLFLQKEFFPSLLVSAWFVVRYFSFVEQTVLVVFPDYSFVTTYSPIFFYICLQVTALWPHICFLWPFMTSYFWLSFPCILMQITPVNGYIQWTIFRSCFITSLSSNCSKISI